MSSASRPETPRPQKPRARGLIDRVRGAYWDFSGSARALLAERPSEATLLSFMMIFAVISLCGDLAAQAYGRSGPWTDQELDALSSKVVGRLLVVPIGFYFCSALIGAVARALGGTGDWYATRAAFVWAMLVAAPLTFASQILGAVAAEAANPPEAAQTARLLASAPLSLVALYIWAACLAAAQGFRSPRYVMMVSIGIGAAIAGVGLGLAQLFGGA